MFEDTPELLQAMLEYKKITDKGVGYANIDKGSRS